MSESTAQTQAQHQGRATEIEVRTSASPEQIWNAWVNPELISQWFADHAEGWAHKGEQVTWIFDEFGYRMPYYVVESIPGECVAFGGQIPGRIPFLLEVTLRREHGETVVRLVNSGFLEGGSFDEEYEGVASGWAMALAMLKYYAENHYGTPKQQYILMQEAEFSLPDLPAWFTRSELLNQWLTSAAQIGNAGETFSLSLQDGPRIDGVVAAITRREASFVWPGQNALLELKGWGAGAKKILAVRMTGWNSPAIEPLRPLLQSALGRLASALGTAAGSGQ